jgi:hypothetical protein
MPLEVGKTINTIVDKILNAPIIRTAANNPIYYGLVITIIIVLIILFTFRDVESEESLMILSLRTGFWVMLFMVTALFVQNKVLTLSFENSHRDGQYTGTFMPIYTGGERVSVKYPAATLESSVITPTSIDISGL